MVCGIAIETFLEIYFMKRNQWILTGLAAAGLATFLINKYNGKKQISVSSSGSKLYKKHLTDVFSNAKNMGTSVMA